MSTGKFGATIALVGGLIGLLPGHAGAAALSFDDTGADERITVSACDFENGAFVNGTLMGLCGVGYGGSVTLAESGGSITFSGGWVDLGAAGTGSRTIYLVEADTPTLVSDIFTYSWVSSGPGTANILAEFRSDLAGDLGSLPGGVNPGDVFVEDGRPVSFDLAFLSGRIQSSTDVPEPGSLALVGLGLAGVLSSRSRKA